MPKPTSIEDSSFIFEGLCIVDANNDENDLFGALRVDGMTVSYSVSDGPGLNPMQAVDLLTAIEAIVTRFPDSGPLPVVIYLSKKSYGINAEIFPADLVDYSKSILFACSQIEAVATYVLDDNLDRTIHLYVGDEELHREFHVFQDHVQEWRPER